MTFTHQSSPYLFSRHDLFQPCVLPPMATKPTVTTASVQHFALSFCHAPSPQRDFSAAVSQQHSHISGVPRPFRAVTVVVAAKPHVTVVVTTVAPLQTLEQLSTAAVDAAVLFRISILPTSSRRSSQLQSTAKQPREHQHKRSGLLPAATRDAVTRLTSETSKAALSSSESARRTAR